MPFTHPHPRLDMLPGRRWRVVDPLVYIPPREIYPAPVEVPEGFISDLASVPRPFWRLFPPHGDYAPAAIVHDWLYDTGYLDRRTADAVFLAAMTETGVGLITRRTLWAAVRIGGWIPWHVRS